MAQVFVIVIPATSIERVFLVWKTWFWDVVDVEKNFIRVENSIECREGQGSCIKYRKTL